MADISKIKLPSGNTYDIKDAVAREMISGGVAFNICWDGTSAPTVSAIPAGVVVTYNDVEYTGTMAASSAQPGTFYLVYNSDTANNSYSEYVTVGPTGSKTWEKIGDTVVDLSNLGDLAYLDTVTLSKGSGDNVLGEATTFTAASSSVSFSGGSTDKCLGSDATFTTTVTPTTTNIKATASGAAVGADGTDTFVKSYPGATSKLATTSVPNVTAVDSWSFTMGSGSDSETLIISGDNATLGTAITAATGSLDANGSGASVMTGLGTATTASALTGVKVTSQPTVALSAGATAGTGVVSVATGITSASTTTDNKDEVTAVTSIGTGTAAAQAITVGTNDKVKVAKYDDLSVSAS